MYCFLNGFIVRFIPTYMGNADERFVYVRGSSVHPHVHGERSVIDSSMG